MGKIVNENQQYFQTNAELARKNSDLHLQLQRSTKMNNLLLQQSFEIRSKLAEISGKNAILEEKNQQYKRKLAELKELTKNLLDAIHQVQLSPVSCQQPAKKISFQKPLEITRLENSMKLVDLLDREKKHRPLVELDVIEEEEEMEEEKATLEAFQIEPKNLKQEKKFNQNDDLISTERINAIAALQKDPISSPEKKNAIFLPEKKRSLKTNDSQPFNQQENSHSIEKTFLTDSEANTMEERMIQLIQQKRTQKEKETKNCIIQSRSQEQLETKNCIIQSKTQQQSEMKNCLVSSKALSEQNQQNGQSSNLHSTARRTRKVINYKLPNLNTKLRKGDPFTDDFGND